MPGIHRSRRQGGRASAKGGEQPDVTAFYNEGFADVADRELVEAFTRHFLVLDTAGGRRVLPQESDLLSRIPVEN